MTKPCCGCILPTYVTQHTYDSQHSTSWGLSRHCLLVHIPYLQHIYICHRSGQAVSFEDGRMAARNLSVRTSSAIEAHVGHVTERLVASACALVPGDHSLALDQSQSR